MRRLLLWAFLASLPLRVRAAGTVTVPQARAVQAQFAGADLRSLGLPAALAPLWSSFDPSSPRDLALIAPVAQAWQATREGGLPAAQVGPLARRIIEAEVAAAAERAVLAEAPAEQLRETREELERLRLLTTLYELRDSDNLVKMAQARVVERLTADTVAKVSRTAAALGEARRDPGAPPAVRGALAPRPNGPGLLPASSLERAAGEDLPAQPAPPGPAPETEALPWWRRAWAAAVDYFSAPVVDKQEGSPGMQAFRRFEAAYLYARTARSTLEEIARLRAMGSSAAVQAYLRLEGEKILEVIRLRSGKATLGFHYNMHGGQPDEYVRRGIRPTLGDRVTNRNENIFTFDARPKVFYYQAPGESLYDILDSDRMDAWPLRLRMGYALTVFDLDDPALVQGRAEGRVVDHTMSTWNRSMAFLDGSGIPYSAFVLPPLDVFNGVARKIGYQGWWLSRDEETLAVMRYIEAAALSDEAFLP